MGKHIDILTARQVNTKGAGFHADGGHLYLRVKPTGSRSWVFRYKKPGIVINEKTGEPTAGHKSIDVGLGSSVDRSLLQARELAVKMRTVLADGGDPAGVVRVKADAKSMTFEDYAKELIEAKRPSWRNAKHAQQWENTLAQYAYPFIGDKLPAEITLADVLEILNKNKMWVDKNESAVRLRQRIEMTLDAAAVREKAHGRYNPARWKGNLDLLLPQPRKVNQRTHFVSLPYSDIPRVMSELRGKDFMSAYCLRFTILTAARSTEARGALWREFDLKNRMWTIPAHRMKANNSHRVPLCDEALQILGKMKEWRIGDAARVFPGPRGGLLSDGAVNKTLHRVAPDVVVVMPTGEEETKHITVHGMRSSFRIWADENTKFPRPILEEALAHTNPNKVEEAYLRKDKNQRPVDKRRVELMSAWGDYCSSKGKIMQWKSGKKL